MERGQDGRKGSEWERNFTISAVLVPSSVWFCCTTDVRHLCFCSLPVLTVIPKSPSFQIGSGWNFGRILPEVNTHHLMESGLLFDATLLRWQPWVRLMQKNCCHLVSEHEAPARHLCSSVCQFLIYSTFILVSNTFDIFYTSKNNK